MASTTIIIGCAGAGAAIARRLAAAKQSTHLLSRNAEKLRLVAEPLGVPFTAVDVMDVAAYEQTLKSIAATHERINGLVYAVGTIPLKPMRSASAADFLDAFKINTLGAFLAIKHLAPALSAGAVPGSIVLFSTVAASSGFPNHTAIAAAKGAIEALGRSAAAELAPKVRVNVIAPSLTLTPLAAKLTANDAMRQSLADAHPLQRLGTVDDLASLACFLLDDEQSGWISGQTIAVDGGRSTLRPRN